MTLRWYPTELDFLPFETVFGNREWDSTDIRRLELGEDANDRPRPYRGGPIVGLPGGHTCGEPSWWLDGYPWPYDGPEVQYDADGIPACCGRAPVAWVGSGSAPSSVVTYTGPTPEPSNACLTAPELEIGQEYSWQVDVPILVTQWWVYPLPGAGTYAVYLDTDATPGSNVNFVVQVASSCFGGGAVFLSEGVNFIAVGASDNIYFRVSRAVSGSTEYVYTWRIEPFP